MRYMELLLICFFISICSVLFSNGIRIYINLENENEYYINQNNSCYFISKSFKNACEGKGFNSLYQWQNVCKSLWNLEYIGWATENEKYVYGLWYSDEVKGEVYWRIPDNE